MQMFQSTVDILGCAAEGAAAVFWADAPTLQWTKAKNLSLMCSPNIAACEGLVETYFMQVCPAFTFGAYLAVVS